VYIEKPVTEVFAYTSNFENTAKWQGGVESVEASGNTVGETFTEVRKFLGREMRTTLEVTAFEPNAKWAAKVLQGPVPYEVVTTFESTNGGTTVFVHIDGEPTGFFKVAQGAVQGQLEKSLEEDLQRLKAQVEAA
jgi:uncharacterized membrane protein